MPNTTPIPELIATELVARLEAITEENGYQFNVAEVVRPNKDGSNWRLKHLSVAVMQGNDAINVEISHPGNPPAEGHDLNMKIACVSRDNDDSHATNTNLMVATVKKAIASVDDWHRLGGYAIDAEWGEIEAYTSPEGELYGALINLDIRYRVSEYDAFVVMN